MAQVGPKLAQVGPKLVPSWTYGGQFSLVKMMSKWRFSKIYGLTYPKHAEESKISNEQLIIEIILKRFILPPFLPLKIDLHMSTVGAEMAQDEAKLGILDPILGLCWLMLELCWAILEHLRPILKHVSRCTIWLHPQCWVWYGFYHAKWAPT